MSTIVVFCGFICAGFHPFEVVDCASKKQLHVTKN